MSAKSTRNTEICERYREGESQGQLAKVFNISVVRVGQILHRAGVTKQERKKPSSGNQRTSFTGILLSPRIKEAVQHAAEMENKSVSKFISELLVEEVSRRGIPLRSEKDLEKEPPLPL